LTFVSAQTDGGIKISLRAICSASQKKKQNKNSCLFYFESTVIGVVHHILNKHVNMKFHTIFIMRYITIEKKNNPDIPDGFNFWHNRRHNNPPNMTRNFGTIMV
jgi:hypothetical protein